MTVPPDPNNPNPGGQPVPPNTPPPPPPPGEGFGQPAPPSFPGEGAVPPPPGSGGPGGYDPNAYGGGAPQTNQKAMWSMILGIVALVCCSVVTGIPALILGLQSRKEIQASGGRQTGEGMGLAGVVLGTLSIVFLLLYLIMWATGMFDPYFAIRA